MSKKPTRRDFIGASAASGASAAAKHAGLPVSEVTANERALRAQARENTQAELYKALYTYRQAQGRFYGTAANVTDYDNLDFLPGHIEHHHIKDIDDAEEAMKKEYTAFSELLEKHNKKYPEGFTLKQLLTRADSFSGADKDFFSANYSKDDFKKHMLSAFPEIQTHALRSADMFQRKEPLFNMEPDQAVAHIRERARLLDQLGKMAENLCQAVPGADMYSIRHTFSDVINDIWHEQPPGRAGVTNAILKEATQRIDRSGYKAVSDHVAKELVNTKKWARKRAKEKVEREQRYKEEKLEKSPIRESIKFLDEHTDAIFVTMGNTREEAQTIVDVINECNKMMNFGGHKDEAARIDPANIEKQFEVKDIIPKEKLPEGFPIMVPTKSYGYTYGVTVSKAQFEAIEEFQEKSPFLTKAIARGLEQRRPNDKGLF